MHHVLNRSSFRIRCPASGVIRLLSRHNHLRAFHDHRVGIAPSTSLAQGVGKIIATFLERLRIPNEPIPFADTLHQECVDEGMRRGYLMDGAPSMQTYLRDSVVYIDATCGHLPHRPTVIWYTFLTSCVLCADDTITRFPSERTNIYQFNERFVQGQAQGNGVLKALAGLLHEARILFPPTASNLVVTSILNQINAHRIEQEIKNIPISSAAHGYATYLRMLSGAPEAYMVGIFPREIPLKDYIQAMPEMMLYFINANDIMSFYKEELADESTNHISIMAACNRTSRLDALNAMAERTVVAYDRIVEALRGSPEACEAFKKFAEGYVRYHITVSRYRFADLVLQ